MFKYIPALLLIHAGYSLMKWRQFLLLENQSNNFYVPTDIMVELIIATILCLLVIVSRVADFQPIRDLSCQFTYDSAFWQPRLNNMNIMNSRAPSISSLVKNHLTSLPQL